MIGAAVAALAVAAVLPGIAERPGTDLELTDQPPGACPVTDPATSSFTSPPTPHVFADPGIEGGAWYGTPDLWTVVTDPSGARKSVWWSADFDGGHEPQPDIRVVYQRLDEPDADPIVLEGPATNAFTDEQGWFMIAGMEPDDPGCWQATATYNDAELSYIYRIVEPDESPASEPFEAGPDIDEDSESALGVEVQPLEVDTPVSLRVLAVQFNNPSLAIIDLDPGERSLYPPGAHPLPADYIGGGLVLSDDTLAVWQDGTVRIYPEGLAGEPLVHTPTELINTPDAAPSLRVLPTVDETAIWVVQIGACCPDAIDGIAERIDLTTGEVTATVQLPPNTFPSAATADGMLFNTRQMIDAAQVPGADPDGGWINEPGSERILHTDLDGTVTEFAAGEVFAVSGDTVLVRRCGLDPAPDDCTLELIDVRSGDRRLVELPIEGHWAQVNLPVVPGEHPPWNATAPDGRILAAITIRQPGDQKPTETHLAIIDPDRGEATLVHRYDGPPTPAIWDRTGTNIVFTNGHDLTVLDPTNGTTSTLPDAIPDDHYVISAG